MMVAGISGSALAGLEFEQVNLSDTVSPVLESYSYTFPFKNEGATPIEIIKVKSSCGCTTAKLEKMVYQPGEAGTIEGVFSKGSRTGKQEVSVSVISSNAVSGIETVELSLQLEIPQLLESNPSMVLWRTGSEPTEKAIAVKLSDKFDVQIKAVEIDSSTFSIQLVDGESPTEKKFLIKPVSTATSTTAKVMADVIINGKIEKKFYFYALVR
jgi:hypothetical protein